MKASTEEMPTQDGATPLAAELGAPEIPQAELAEGAAAPMVWSFLTTGVIQLIQAIVGILLARILGPSDRGVLAALILWPTLMATIGSLGLAQSATYHAARVSRLGDLVGGILCVVVLDSAFLVAVGWAVLPLALGRHGAGVVRDGQLFLTFYIPVLLLSMSMMSVLNGNHRFGWFQSLRLVQIGTLLVGVVALAVTGNMTITSTAAIYVGSYAVTSVIALAVVLRSVWGTLSLGFESVRELLGFGLKSQLSTSMWSLNERADQLVISAFFSAASLGLYVVAVTLTSLTTLVGFSFALVALPMIARLEVHAERQRLAQLIVSATFCCATAVSLPIFLVEPTLIKLLFGNAFVGAAGVGRVLLVAGIVFALNRVLEAVLQAVGRPLESSIGEGLALAVTAGGLAALLPTLGIMGAGVTSLIAYSTSSAFLVRRAAKALDLHALRLLVPERDAIKAMRLRVERRLRSPKR